MAKLKDLNFYEKNYYEKHSFIIQEFLNKKQYFTTLFSHISFFILGTIGIYYILIFIILFVLDALNELYVLTINFPIQLFTIGYWIVSIIALIILFFYITYKFSIFRYVMKSNYGYIVNNKTYTSLQSIPIKILNESQKLNEVGGVFIEYITHLHTGLFRFNIRLIAAGIIAWLIIFGITGVFFIASAFLFCIGMIFVTILKNTIPLNYFIDIGLRLQSLTPTIESQSKLIQSEFEKNMNFSILHSGFEKFSSTFSQIISLVLKLENIEQKANKGNLFDSTKYINSLRSDILTPLTSLRSFLENQKQELINSQKELSRVRVGGSEQEITNTELTSKRSESLLLELERNIVSLDEMILKMR